MIAITSEVPKNTVLQGHVLEKLKELPNDCVDVVITSTPYWGLRDYGPECTAIWNDNSSCVHEWSNIKQDIDNLRLRATPETIVSNNKNTEILTGNTKTSAFCYKCGAWKGQLGLEPSPNLFIEHLGQVFLEIKRVLKPSGSLWLNIGDTYFGGNGKAGRPEGWQDLENAKLSDHAPEDFIKARNKLRSNWLQPKQKMLIPARVAIALQDQGWILRNEIIWHKVNHMPCSVRDRLTAAYESIYFFVKSDRYYFNLDAIRKPLLPSSIKRISEPAVFKQNGGPKQDLLRAPTSPNDNANKSALIMQGLAKRIQRDMANNQNITGANPGDVWSLTTEPLKEEHFAAYPKKLVKRILSCAAPKGALVLDPFTGSGTTLLVAHEMGYDWLGTEIVSKYCDITNKRIERHGKIRLDGFLEECCV